MCGIIGIFNIEPNKNIIKETYENLKKLQHRGRDSFGMLFYNTLNPYLLKDLGKIRMEAINIPECNKSLGHTKYTTAEGRKNIKNEDQMLKVTQPFRGINFRLGEFYLVHNGNIRDFDNVRKIFDLEDEDILNDSHLLVRIIEKLELQRWEDIFQHIMLTIEGSFSIIISTLNGMYCFKDLVGYRPLCIGENESGFCIASESVGLGHYKYVKEIERGVIIKINISGIREEEISVNLNKIKNKKCLFEFIYFMSADSIYKQVETFNIRQLRYQFGIELGKGDKIDKTKVDDKIVIGAPQTGIPSGRGFADYLGINYEQILVKNKNAGRSFILKNDEDRLGEIKKKFIIENGSRLENKELYFVDDSLVRGNTLKIIIEMLKEYKPKKIHIRIASPKVINICEYGIDIPSREELIMNHYSNEKYVDLVGIDSIKFLELEAFYHLFGNNDFCTNCFSNETIDW